MEFQASPTGAELADGLDSGIWSCPSWDDGEAWGGPPEIDDDDLTAVSRIGDESGYDDPLPEWDSDGELLDDSAAARADRALALAESTIDQLLRLAADPELMLADGDRYVEWSRQLERLANKLACPRQALINLMEARGCRIDGPVGLHASPQSFLNALLGISWGEARARVRAARLLAPVQEMNGCRIDPRYPVLAAAQATGEISPDRIDLIARALLEWEKLDGLETANVSPETLAFAEETLARRAKVFGGPELQRVIDQLGAYLNPDGMLDDQPAQEAVRSLEVKPVGRGMRRGMYRVEGWVTGEAGAKTMAVLDPLSKPQPVTDEHGNIVEPDRRDRGMRMHDALEEVMDRSLRAGDLPAHGGTPATMIITATEDDVAAGTGEGVSETGDRFPMHRVYALTDEAEIVRTVFHKRTGDVLYLGRTRRLASYAQTLALVARDGGCSFPGCTKSPKWCQRHHIVDWAKGGETDLPNLTLICPFHHYRFARHGWSAEYKQGRVWWRPPKIIDPDQKPILNTRHRNLHLKT